MFTLQLGTGRLGSTFGFHLARKLCHHFSGNHGRLIEPLSTIDNQHISRHIICGAQVHHRMANLPCFTHSAQWDAVLNHFIGIFLGHSRCQFGGPGSIGNGSGSDSHHANAIHAPFQCQTARQGIHPRLGRTGVCLPVSGRALQGGGNIHDNSILALFQSGMSGMGHVEGTQSINSHDGGKAFGAELIGSGQKVSSRSIDQNI
mmetsp:Transcript_37992/g.78943  ORF Transcript_37992/g.78943 Transcript_37992/m.78943 type:complete len:203 (-) Transcript_37992:455-1063(-)